MTEGRCETCKWWEREGDWQHKAEESDTYTCQRIESDDGIIVWVHHGNDHAVEMGPQFGCILYEARARGEGK